MAGRRADGAATEYLDATFDLRHEQAQQTLVVLRPGKMCIRDRFLASDYASFISAASIDISGGMGGQIAYFPTLKRDFAEAARKRNENA